MFRLKPEKSMSQEDEKKLARSATIQNVLLFGALCGIIRAGTFYLLDVPLPLALKKGDGTSYETILLPAVVQNL